MNLKELQKVIGYNQKYEWDKIALSEMSECNNILDIGCGIGNFISLNKERITGIDKNDDSVMECKKNGFNIIQSDILEYNFNSKSFDGIHCSHLIEHLSPTAAHRLLVIIDSVLKIGGILVIRTPLLTKDFFNDFSHIKPYNPEAILHYLNEDIGYQKTMNNIKGNYKQIFLKYRRPQLFQKINHSKFRLFGIIFNILQKMGITGFQKTGYMIVLLKTSEVSKWKK